MPDASWRPGKLHGKLLALPWADILTTFRHGPMNGRANFSNDCDNLDDMVCGTLNARRSSMP